MGQCMNSHKETIEVKATCTLYFSVVPCIMLNHHMAVPFDPVKDMERVTIQNENYRATSSRGAANYSI